MLVKWKVGENASTFPVSYHLQIVLGNRDLHIMHHDTQSFSWFLKGDFIRGSLEWQCYTCRWIRKNTVIWGSFRSDSVVRICLQCRSCRDMDLTSGSGRCPGGGHGSPLQYSWLENPVGRGAWQATIHGVVKSQKWMKQQHACTVIWEVAYRLNYREPGKEMTVVDSTVPLIMMNL